MLYIIDEKGKGHGVLAEFGVTHGVNGEKSITGTIYTNEEVIHGIDRGWKLRFEGETYTFIYANPVDLGEVVQVEFDAVHSFFYDFSKSTVNEQLKDGSHTMQAYLDFIFKDSGYTFRLDTQVNAFEKQSFGYKNRLALFNDVISSAGVEFSVNGSVVRIIDRVGNDLSTVVRKGFNLNDLTIEKNIGDFVTAQKGFGAWNDEEDHSKGRLEVEYISPLEGIYGRLDADPIVDERYTNANSLRARLENNVEGSYSISVALDMADLTKAGYEYKQPQEGDYIMAINEDLGFKRKIRIVSYTSKYDTSGELIDHNITANSLGMVKEAIGGQAKVQNSINELRDEIAQTRREVTEVRVSADGKTNNYWSNTAPNPQEYKLNIGDTWYDTSGEDVVIYGWNGVEWRRVSFDKTAFERQFAEIKNKTQEMTASIAETDNKANNALEKVDVNTNLISEQKKTLDDINLVVIPHLAETISDSLESDNAAIQDVFYNLTEVTILANNAFEKAQANEGKLTTVEQTVDDLKGEISQKVTSAEVTDTLNTFNETIRTQTASQITESLTGYAKTGDLTSLAQNIRTETAESLKSVYTKTETDGLLGGMSQKINSVQKTADGNEALIAKIQETPATYLADYQKLINRADLFERTLGTTDSEVGENVSRMVQTSGIIQSEVAKMDLASGSEISTLQTQLADSWGVKIKSADEAISSINLTTTGPRLAGKIIELDGNTHVDGDFWAKEVNAIKVNADNITTGQLDGSRIRANSIDVNSLAGNRATLVSAGLISSSGGSLELNGDLILSTASDNSQVYIGQGILGIRNTSGATIGQFGYQNTGSSPITTIQNSWGTHFRIMMRRDPNHPTITNKEAFYITSGGTEMYLKTDDIYLNPSNRVNINSSVTISDELRMQGHSIVNPYGINFMGGGSLYTLSGGNETRLEGSGRLSLRVNGSEKMRLDTTHIYMYQTLNMQNNAITQQSDERLKKNIRTLKDDDLEKIRQLRIVSYEWRDENKKGRHKGVVAQEFAKVYPELVDEVNGILSINSTELEMAKLHAIQQLDEETRSEIESLKAQIASLQDELALLKGD